MGGVSMMGPLCGRHARYGDTYIIFLRSPIFVVAPCQISQAYTTRHNGHPFQVSNRWSSMYGPPPICCPLSFLQIARLLSLHGLPAVRMRILGLQLRWSDKDKGRDLFGIVGDIGGAITTSNRGGFENRSMSFKIVLCRCTYTPDFDFPRAHIPTAHS